MEKWTILGKFPSAKIFSSFICNKRTRSILPTLFFLLPSFSLLFQEVKMFIWVPWFVCRRLLEYGLKPVSLIRLRVQKLILPLLLKTLPDLRLYESSDACCILSQLSHRRTKNEIFLFPRDFTRLSAHIIIPCPSPLCWSEITKENYLQNISYFNFCSTCKILHDLSPDWRDLKKIYQKSTHSGRILPCIYPVHKVCRFESYRS